MANKETIKSWFRNGAKPTEKQFWEWIDSFFHKEEKIPMKSVEGMDKALEGKADADLLDNKADLDNGKLRLSQMPEHPLISRNEEKNITAIGTSKRAIVAPEYLKNSLIIGTNVAPVITGAPDNNNGNYSQGYILTGLDILPNFVGNTSYNPTHPAHDSHVVYGRDIGRGIVDADNFTAFGTALFSRNDVPLALHNTIVGNNITNAKKSGIDPNRTVTSSNGFNLRTSLAGNVLVGNYIWADDFHSATIVGQSAKHFSYAFNSVVIGNDNQNFNGVKYPGETGLVDYLDNDVIIGNGLHKDPKRHAPTHNLIIGSTEGYGCGGWNPKYIPLIEGNFKDETLQINGTLGIHQRKPEQNQAQMGVIPLSLVSIPNGADGKVSYDPATGDVTLTNAPAGRYVLARNVGVGDYIFDMAPRGITGGFFNLRTLSVTYDNATTYQYRNVLANSRTGGNREFAFELVGTVSGKLSVKLTKIIANKTVAPSFISEDVDGQTNFEARFGKASGNFIALGKNTGTSFYTNKPEGDVLIGNGTATKTVSFESNVMIGNGTAPNSIQSRSSVLIGNYILITSTADNHRNVIVGDKAAASAALINRSVVLGAAALVGFNTSGTEIHAIGEGVGRTITSGRRFIVIGRDGAFGTANLTDSICLVPDTDGGKKSFGNNPTVTNAIVISGKGINGHGSNTTTIGNPDTQEAHIYGKMNLYKPLKLARYTQAQIRALSPNAEEGDLVYQTDADKGIKMFDGSVWMGLALAYP